MGLATYLLLAWLPICSSFAVSNVEGPADISKGPDSTETLFKWGRHEKIWGVDNLQVATVGSPPHRGLKLTKDIAAGEGIIGVDFDHIISALGVETNETLGRVFDHYKDEPLLFHFLDGRPILKPRLTLMMMLQRKLGIESKYYHYINNLPTKFSIISEFSEPELSQLRGVTSPLGNVVENAHANNAELRREYDLFFPKLTKAFPDVFIGDFTFEDFLWARNVIDTRCFGFIRENGDRDIGMIPIADMANHGNVQVTWKTVDGMVQLYTRQAFNKGDEFLLNYGQRSNSYLLEHYGFVLPDNQIHDNPCEKSDVECLVKKLKAFPSSMREDLDLLNKPDLSFNMQNAIRLRVEERLHLMNLDEEGKMALAAQ